MRDRLRQVKFSRDAGNIRAMLRRGCGYRDHEYLLLKVHKATAARHVMRRAA